MLLIRWRASATVISVWFQLNHVQLGFIDDKSDTDAALISATNGVCEYKHPLHNTWTLWYFKVEKAREWSENQRRVASFGTAEDFWA